MSDKKRTLFGVIVAQVADIEQKLLLNGIIEQAQSLDIDIAVFSNIYNPFETDFSLNYENTIYELALSHNLDGLILISESLISRSLMENIRQKLITRNDIPIVITGSFTSVFDLPNCTFINTNDEVDIRTVTEHLIKQHGFVKIDMLTGNEELEVSQMRISGYKNALENSNIPFESERVHFGDYWMTSGEQLADRYISGELDMPEAIICANDYMAYGILDEFLDHGIRVPEDVTVIGYEYIRKRIFHSPLLTTYQRNRKGIGKSAVNFLYNMINQKAYDIGLPPECIFVPGNSCSCGIRNEQLNEELKAVRNEQNYNFLYLFGQLEHNLTECTSIADCIAVLRKSTYLIRGITDIYLCLSENWYETDHASDNMLYYSIMSETQNIEGIPFNKYEFSDILSSSDKPSAYYFSPLFFTEQIFGYVILKYPSSDTYDYIFRNWLKSVSNALKFLSMKSDIQYLTKCHNLSESRDSLTGLYNKNGLKDAYEAMLLRIDPSNQIFCISLKICLFYDAFTGEQKENELSASLAVSEMLKQLCSRHSLFGQIQDDTFVIITTGSESSGARIADKIHAFLIHQCTQMKDGGMDTFICSSVPCPDRITFEKLMSACNTELTEQIHKISEYRSSSHYPTLIKIRNDIYTNPEKIYSSDEICSRYHISYGHFRMLYKKYFNVSFHQDCINSRISMAKYLLSASKRSIATISEKCGYEDVKYFLRQFHKCTGFTPSKYRSM